MEDRKNLLMDRSYVVIDLEATGFSPKTGCKIIEIAAVKIVDGEIIDKRSQLIDPEVVIPKHIIGITGITDSMVAGKPRIEKVLPEFYGFIGDSVIVAHNARFDWNTYLLYYFAECGLYPDNEVMDTLVMSKQMYKTCKNHKLGSLCEMLGIELNGAHRALGDATATAELFIRMMSVTE